MSGWQNFYVIVGAAGSTLIGIQFVVITLVATVRRELANEESIHAFATPTVVHFAIALVIAAIMSAPWHSLVAASIAIAFCALAAFGYAVGVIHRARRQTQYQPTREDWVWYTILPCVIDFAMLVAALFLSAGGEWPLYVVAASALGLLLIGVHNAWDSVTYMVVGGE
jgi:amino acid transporter